MIWSTLSTLWPFILAALAAVAGLGYRAKVASDARKDERAEIELEDAKARQDTERRMAAAPRVGSDADLVERLRRGGF